MAAKQVRRAIPARQMIRRCPIEDEKQDTSEPEDVIRVPAERLSLQLLRTHIAEMSRNRARKLIFGIVARPSLALLLPPAIHDEDLAEFGPDVDAPWVEVFVAVAPSSAVLHRLRGVAHDSNESLERRRGDRIDSTAITTLDEQAQ